MNPQTLEQAVAAHPFLIAISEHHIRLLADSASKTTFEAGKLIFREGETANRFYLIETGKVALESPGKSNEPVTIDVIGAGDLLGWSWLFPRTQSSSTARFCASIATRIHRSVLNCSSE